MNHAFSMSQIASFIGIHYMSYQPVPDDIALVKFNNGYSFDFLQQSECFQES